MPAQRRNKQTVPKQHREDMEHFQHSSDTYFNRELSLIEFNRRVLAQALDPDLPI